MQREPMRCRLAALFATMFIAGCAHFTGASDAFVMQGSRWQGRLSVKVEAQPVQAFSASFELMGDAGTGTLDLLTPLGSTAARLQWSPQGAKLQTTGEFKQFESLDALTEYATGAALPVTSLFAWLQAQSPPTPGWQADLSQINAGRLSARRLQPSPAVELKIVLDR